MFVESMNKSFTVSMFLLSILMSSFFEVMLLSFKNWISCLLLLNFRNSLHTLDRRPLSGRCFANIFSQSVACLCIFLIAATFVEKTVIAPSLLPLLHCQQSLDYIYVGLSLDSISCSIDLFVYPFANTTLRLDYCSFTVSLEVR